MSDSVTTIKVDTAREWSSWLTCLTVGILLYESFTGFAILFLPFSLFNQFSVLFHTLIGLISFLPTAWYSYTHWRVRRVGSLSHYQVVGYGTFFSLFICFFSGVVLTLQAAFGRRIDAFWDMVHIGSSIVFFLLMTLHIMTLVFRSAGGLNLNNMGDAKVRFYVRSSVSCVVLCLITFASLLFYPSQQWNQPFSPDYDWRFGEDRPFAPSLARVDYNGREIEIVSAVLEKLEPAKRDAFSQAYRNHERARLGLYRQVMQSLSDSNAPADVHAEFEEQFADYTRFVSRRGAVDPELLAGSNRCGTSGCHDDIYKEWAPSAHRYSSLDQMFQKTQEFMAAETSPEQTRYCAGCHDPISLFGGAKNKSNITLSAKGSDEGISCVVCHSIVQADTQGNADYTLQPPLPYLFEKYSGETAAWISNFLIRSYPRHHVESYSRTLYKSAEYCGACHKQYIDKEVNTDIGRVQGQNQYDSWRKSHWYHDDNPEKTISCRECHMPLQESNDPSSGDPYDFNRSRGDQKHRSHRFLASNQYIPVLHQLPDADRHVQLTEDWLRGEIDIPEIADRWVTGPVVEMEIQVPQRVKPGEEIQIQVLLVNNKTGHDFPTGPLDMIESWLELIVSDEHGVVRFHAGSIDDGGDVLESPLIFKADGFDRKGELIDRHNLWDMVGARYKRAMFPGVSDAVNISMLCPETSVKSTHSSPVRSSAFGLHIPQTSEANTLQVSAILWYRKANASFLKRIYGIDTELRSPATDISRASAMIQIDA